MENAVDLLARAPPSAGLDDAVLDAIVLSSCADGLAKGELDTVTQLAAALPSFARCAIRAETSWASASDRRSKGSTRWASKTRSARLGEKVEGVDAKKQVFTAAVVVQIADGHLTNEENALLLDLADVLGLDETSVRKIRSEMESVLGAPKSVTSERSEQEERA